MPQKMWNHEACGHGELGERDGQEFCRECGQKGVFVGWGFGMFEAMSAYTKFFKLPALGGAGILASKLLHPLADICPACNGNGVIGSEHDDHCQYCKECDGTGRRLNCPESVFLAAHQQVVNQMHAAADREADRKAAAEAARKEKRKSNKCKKQKDNRLQSERFERLHKTEMKVVPSQQGIGFEFVGYLTTKKSYSGDTMSVADQVESILEMQKRFPEALRESKELWYRANCGRGGMSVVGEVPQCDECVHRHANGYSCVAFPDGIPDDIFGNVHNHRNSYPGDHGIRFRYMLPKDEEDG